MMKFNHLTGNETTTLIPLLWHQFVGSLHIFDFYFDKEIKIPLYWFIKIKIPPLKISKKFDSPQKLTSPPLDIVNECSLRPQVWLNDL